MRVQEYRWRAHIEPMWSWWDVSGLDLGKQRKTDALEIHFGSILNWREKRKVSMTSRFLAQTTGRMVMIIYKVEETGEGAGMCKTKHSINSTSKIPVPVIWLYWRNAFPFYYHFTFPQRLSSENHNCSYNINNIWFHLVGKQQRWNSGGGN